MIAVSSAASCMCCARAAAWRDRSPEYGPSTTIYNRYNRWSAQGLWRKLFERLAAAGNIPDSSASTAPYQGSPLCGWAKKRKAAQAIGRSRGGRTSKIHALANAQGKPIAFVLTPGKRRRHQPSPPRCSTTSLSPCRLLAE